MSDQAIAKHHGINTIYGANLQWRNMSKSVIAKVAVIKINNFTVGVGLPLQAIAANSFKSASLFFRTPNLSNTACHCRKQQSYIRPLPSIPIYLL